MEGKSWTSLVAQKAKCLPTMRETRFDPWVGKIPWRRKWQPTPVFLPGKSHGWRSLVGYSPWGHKESDTTERLHFHFQVMCDSIWPHGLLHIRLLCPPLSPRLCSDSCPLSWWCYLTILFSTAPCPFAFTLSHHQGLFQWVGSLHQMAKVLELQLQRPSFRWIFPLGLTGLISLQPKGLSRIFSSTPVQKHQFFSAQPSLRSNSQVRTWRLEKP